METLKQIGVGLCVVAVVCAGMAWAVCGREIQDAVNRRAEGRGLEAPLPAPEDTDVTLSLVIDPKEHGVADTQVTKSYSASGTLRVMNQDQSPLMTSAATTRMAIGQYVEFRLEDVTTSGGYPPGVVPEGGSPGWNGFVYMATFEDPLFPVLALGYDITGDNPQWIWVGESTGWEGSIDWSITASHSHIDRTQVLGVHMGSDAGPTHSNERAIADVWEASGKQSVTYTFGSFTAVSKPEADAVIPPPGSGIGVSATMHKGGTAGTTTVYGKFENLQVSNIPLQLDGIYKQFSGIECYLQGDGNNINVETRDSIGVSHFSQDGSFTPPFMLDLTQIGLCDWGETSHNDRYDNVLVWLYDSNSVCPCWQSPTCTCTAPPGYWPRNLGAGINPLDCYCPFCGSQLRPHGMNRVSYISADWPDTSDTDWVSTGPFEECTACPLPIGELRRIFSPYVQRVAPYPGWQRSDGATCELWSGHIGFLLDRTSLRANNLPVSA